MDSVAKKKEEELLTRAHIDFEKPLIKHAFLRVHNEFISEDLVQETFLRTWKYVLKGGEIAIMKAFLYHILNDLIIDQYRKERHKTYSLDLLTDSGFDVATSEHEHLGESLEAKVAIGYIEELPEKYRKVVYMRIILDMSLEEISNETKRTRNSVAVQIHRGLKRIQSLYRKRISG